MAKLSKPKLKGHREYTGARAVIHSYTNYELLGRIFAERLRRRDYELQYGETYQ